MPRPTSGGSWARTSSARVSRPRDSLHWLCSTTAGGTLELRVLRNRLRWSKANATEVTGTLAAAGLITQAAR